MTVFSNIYKDKNDLYKYRKIARHSFLFFCLRVICITKELFDFVRDCSFVPDDKFIFQNK